MEWGREVGEGREEWGRGGGKKEEKAWDWGNAFTLILLVQPSSVAAERVFLP